MRNSSRGLLTAMLLLLPASPALAGDVVVELDAGDGFVIEDNSGTVERLRVDEATGNISRNDQLLLHTTGTNSTFFGAGAGNLTTTGDSNTAFGRGALSSNTGGNASCKVEQHACRERSHQSCRSGRAACEQ